MDTTDKYIRKLELKNEEMKQKIYDLEAEIVNLKEDRDVWKALFKKFRKFKNE